MIWDNPPSSVFKYMFFFDYFWQKFATIAGVTRGSLVLVHFALN